MNRSGCPRSAASRCRSRWCPSDWARRGARSRPRPRPSVAPGRPCCDAPRMATLSSRTAGTGSSMPHSSGSPIRSRSPSVSTVLQAWSSTACSLGSRTRPWWPARAAYASSSGVEPVLSEEEVLMFASPTLRAPCAVTLALGLALALRDRDRQGSDHRQGRYRALQPAGFGRHREDQERVPADQSDAQQGFERGRGQITRRIRRPQRGTRERGCQALCLPVHGAGAQGYARLLQVAARPQVDRGGARYPRSEHENWADLGREPVARGYRQDARGNEKTRSRHLNAVPLTAWTRPYGRS